MVQTGLLTGTLRLQLVEMEASLAVATVGSVSLRLGARTCGYQQGALAALVVLPSRVRRQICKGTYLI